MMKMEEWEEEECKLSMKVNKHPKEERVAVLSIWMILTTMTMMMGICLQRKNLRKRKLPTMMTASLQALF